MRLVFAGTPEFAARALARLHAAGHDIALVLTQPDRPAGRGMKLHPSPVKQLALELGIAVAQPRSLRLDGRWPEEAAAGQAALQQADAQAMVVAAYGLILPQWVLDRMRQQLPDGKPGLGCLNIHASLLPRWRGAAPIHRAIEAGDSQTGVTIMQMDAGLDTGDMLLWQALDIHRDDTTASLHDRLAALGAELAVRALERAAVGDLPGTPQPDAGITYAHKVDKTHAALDWTLEAQVLERRVRAFQPAPGAWTVFAGEVLKVWRAEVVAAEAVSQPPGTVLAADAGGVVVACGAGSSLRLLELQRAGGKRMDAAAFLRGAEVRAGMQLSGGAA